MIHLISPFEEYITERISITTPHFIGLYGPYTAAKMPLPLQRSDFHCWQGHYIDYYTLCLWFHSFFTCRFYTIFKMI